ncbi:ABC transporter permease [Actinoplanes sp. NPDC020271]|uniref:ABC transporter permease n=1 Tax=Actinoplanes sp. NPDC020271 TaxID=3363896 RepID=UPI00378AEB81
MTNLSFHAFEYWAYRHRRTWRSTAFPTLMAPVLYLAAMGLGLGGLIDRGAGADLGGLRYVVFLTPGILVATTMQTAVQESSWPVLGAMRWWKSYLAMRVTPLRAVDMLTGHLMFITVRLFITSAAFLAVAAAFGVLQSLWALVAVPVAVLCGLAHAAPVAGYAIARNSERGFASLFRFGVLPMFLFSGAFFPIEQLPAKLEVVAYVIPLWHGIDLCRDLVLGRASVGSALVHVTYLLAWVAAGFTLALRSYRRKLER